MQLPSGCDEQLEIPHRLGRVLMSVPTSFIMNYMQDEGKRHRMTCDRLFISLLFHSEYIGQTPSTIQIST